MKPPLTPVELGLNPLDPKEIEDAYKNLRTKINTAVVSGDAIDAVLQWWDLLYALNHAWAAARIFFSRDTSCLDARHIWADLNCIEPTLDEMYGHLAAAVTHSVFADDIAKRFGSGYIKILDKHARRLSKDIELEREEHECKGRYLRLVSSSEINIAGKNCGLAFLRSQATNKDRSVRSAAYHARCRLLQRIGSDLDTIFSRLVEIRTSSANSKGCATFSREHANSSGMVLSQRDIIAFRNAVQEEVVPLVEEMRATRARDLKLDRIQPYDESALFNTELHSEETVGTQDLVVIVADLISQCDTDLGKWFQKMLDTQMVEVSNNRFRAPGAFAVALPKLRSSYISMTSRGTPEDISTLIHECGHAYHLENSLFKVPTELLYPPSAIAEMQATALELLVLGGNVVRPGVDATVLQTQTTSRLLSRIPYICAIDEFQEWIYCHSNVTSGDRLDAWRMINARYRPHLAGIDDLEESRDWQLQKHVYLSPYYFIEYAVGAVFSLQIALSEVSDPIKHWRELRFENCETPLSDIVARMGVPSPVDPGSIKHMVASFRRKLG